MREVLNPLVWWPAGLGRRKWGIEGGKNRVEGMVRTEGLSGVDLRRRGREEGTVAAPFRCWDAVHGDSGGGGGGCLS